MNEGVIIEKILPYITHSSLVKKRLMRWLRLRILRIVSSVLVPGLLPRNSRRWEGNLGTGNKMKLHYI